MTLDTGVLLLGEHSPTRLAALAQLAEALGYGYVWYADERFFREVYSGLTVIATRTSRVRLGPCVTDPYARHPALTAMAIATLDEISGHRAVLGLGAGVSGFKELGVARDRPAVAMRETIEIVRALLRGERVAYDGAVVRAAGVRLNFAPPRAAVPIFVASNAPRGLEVAGRLADGAIMQGCVADRALRYFKEHVARGATAAGRPPADVALVARINVCIDDDPRVAKDLMRRSIANSLLAQQPDFPGFVAAGLEVPQGLREKLRGLSYGYGNDALARIAAEVPDVYVDSLTLAGTADDVAAGVARLTAAGIRQLLMFPMDPAGKIERTIERFATEVLPRAARLAGGTTGRMLT
ncbi:MAG: LLM class flavin-dependent oxidoreductase [Armatimonadota bacterium]|nr:LLM class flavin-dependent oxidoreductase [Armatimonadota bacterium]MDR7453864.1 LLM class flavin-dependent oxidoreductase [Armatimonadota bacterium]MDR7457563.1 LLM class flavin-dependent oxidoreductase [Armatimonadota bacterium]MDR7495691.1 LLM class flavin-dependent oxidoreductase [Armatimonadota bacterium]MDR7511063.1 LLM class flavin-dependent oxidoreductase [Armatimonadota bacterium]